MMMNSVIPLKFPRLLSLLFAWAWALISLAIGISAFVKSNRDKNRLRSEVPRPATVFLDTNDVFHSGVVVTAVSGVIMVLCMLYIGLLIVDANARSGISSRTLPLQYITLGFLAAWLFATQIPVSLFVATRSVKVAASIDGINVPNGILKTIERALGAKTAYKDYDYLQLLAILPWFAFLFTAVAAVVGFLASSSHFRSTYKATPIANTTKELPSQPSSAA
ncbi:hypothetical protein GGX14DRAFT_431874 [Mycena pura]|uniref:Uncharacterized protein n=1 Tax=Mycena pura TaxID=153505 RepID=A0AAD6YHT1_9AGAR|nr:hypothetical protein GGX14DRAFT_431874 [Mycena pura]